MFHVVDHFKALEIASSAEHLKTDKEATARAYLAF
jgi:hypothetical protein